MSNVNQTTPSKSSFFPNSKRNVNAKKAEQLRKLALKRNDQSRRTELEEITKGDARVKIPDAVRDFSRIRKAVDAAPPIDNSAKIARLKQQIQAGTYQVNHEALADKILQTEF